jgi:hypothetical protein
MSIVRKHYNWVKEQLEKDSGLRDNNERLYYIFLKESGYDVNKSIAQFLRDMSFRKVPYLDSIARASRKVQENHPELRGKLYCKRKTIKEPGVRKEILSLKH